MMVLTQTPALTRKALPRPLEFPLLTSVRVASIPYKHQRCFQTCGIALAAATETLRPPTVPAKQEPIVIRAKSKPPPLSLLPFPILFRSYLITALSSTPALLTPSLHFLSLLAHSRSAFLQPERNPFLKYILKNTFYAQFCAGETPSEVRRTVFELKKIGFQGVILAYAREIVLEPGVKIENKADSELEEIERWSRGTLETVELSERGEYAALKFSGAGSSAIRQLIYKKQPDKIIDNAIIRICELARKRDVKLLIDAEQHTVQDGIDEWSLNLQRRYNRNGEAIVYGTYQAYLRSTPATLARHLAIAEKEGFVLGVKLVRGAYMGGDPRQLFWATKEGTDRAYDGITSALLERNWNNLLKPLERTVEVAPGFPNVSLVLASHNHESVRKALAVRNDQAHEGKGRTKLAFAQLMGMADEVSCDLVMAGKRCSEVEKPRAFKYLVWGTVTECLKYLLRRAEENRDALARAKEGRLALKQELRRRLLGF